MGNYLIICEKGETKVRVYHYDDKSLDKVKESKRIVKAQIDEVKKQWQEKQSEMDNPEEYQSHKKHQTPGAANPDEDAKSDQAEIGNQSDHDDKQYYDDESEN